MLENFICKVMIVNKTNRSLKLYGSPVNTHGDYDPSPPSEISAGAVANFSLKHTDWSPFGTEGSCQYVCPGTNGNALLQFSYACPSGTGLNSADGVVLSGLGVTVRMIPNPLPQSGHPVNVQFTVT